METVKKCSECGKEFILKRGNQQYCCPKCKRRHGSKYVPLGVRTFVCTFCGTKFESPHRKKFCCEKCRTNHYRNGKGHKTSLPKGTLSLDEVAKIAKEQGLTYGQYMQREYTKAGNYD